VIKLEKKINYDKSVKKTNLLRTWSTIPAQSGKNKTQLILKKSSSHLFGFKRKNLQNLKMYGAGKRRSYKEFEKFFPSETP